MSNNETTNFSSGGGRDYRVRANEKGRHIATNA
jgi:hypothetical protein